MSRHGDVRRRLLRGATALLIAGGLAGPGLVAAQDAAPTAETEITVNVAEAQGTIDVRWANPAITFLTSEGANPTLDASHPEAAVSALFPVTVDDQRPPGTSRDYTLALLCPDLVAAGGAIIPASALSISVQDATQLPKGATGIIANGTSCGSSVPLFSVPAKSGKNTTTFTLVLSTTLPASTAPGTYSGTFTLSILMGGASAP
ncbi:MAG: hypothetical protein WBA46_18685 [Thermomicrobiales bacterium]